MGRWAYFSTGFEYKFVFGGQSSADILNWGQAYTSFCEDSLLDQLAHADDEEKKNLQAQLDWLSTFPSDHDVGRRVWELTDEDLETYPLTSEPYDGSPFVVWDQEGRGNKDDVLSDILIECKNYGFELPEFSKYSTDLQGTVKLWEDFGNEPWAKYWGKKNIDDGESNDPEPFYNWMLGCLVYHQLLYEGDLTCSFEY